MEDGRGERFRSGVADNPLGTALALLLLYGAKGLLGLDSVAANHVCFGLMFVVCAVLLTVSRRRDRAHRSPGEFEKLTISLSANLIVAFVAFYAPYAGRLFPFLDSVLPANRHRPSTAFIVVALVLVRLIGVLLGEDSAAAGMYDFLTTVAVGVGMTYGAVRGYGLASGGFWDHVGGVLLGSLVIPVFLLYSSVLMFGALLTGFALVMIQASELPLSVRICLYMLALLVMAIGAWVAWRMDYPLEYRDQMWDDLASRG